MKSPGGGDEEISHSFILVKALRSKVLGHWVRVNRSNRCWTRLSHKMKHFWCILMYILLFCILMYFVFWRSLAIQGLADQFDSRFTSTLNLEIEFNSILKKKAFRVKGTAKIFTISEWINWEIQESSSYKNKQVTTRRRSAHISNITRHDKDVRKGSMWLEAYNTKNCDFSQTSFSSWAS